MKKSTAYVLICLLTFCICLSGCSERLEKNRTISREAKRYAESMAVEYISEKYGIKAEPLGYDIQGNDVFMAWESSPLVAVPMVYEDKQFCVLLNMHIDSCRHDNWQGEEVAKVLESYILEHFGLPASVYSNLEFHTRGDHGQLYINVDGKTYNADRMLDFYYEGQSTQELMEKINDIEYFGNFVQPDFSMEAVEFDETIFPARLNGSNDQIDIHTEFTLLSEDDPSGKNLIRRHEYDSNDWRRMQESLSYRFTYDEDGAPSLERYFRTFLSAEISGTSFVGMAPFDPAVCINTSGEKLVWCYENNRYDHDGNNSWIVSTDIWEFEQLGPLFYSVVPEEMSAQAAGEEDISSWFCGGIPQRYIDQYAGELCIGNYWPSTGLQLIEEIPHDENFIETFRVFDERAPNVDTESSSVQYAILRLTSRKTIEFDHQK